MKIHSNQFLNLTFLVLTCILSGCATRHVTKPEAQDAKVRTPATTKPINIVDNKQCTGEVGAPPAFVPLLTEVNDLQILAESVKPATEGGLCHAKTYRVNHAFEIFRAWNSNNPDGAKGKWWSFNMPSGKVSDYRREYAICPRYSPLDMMIRCKVKAGTYLALGTGQSAVCNQYLTYEPSATIQIFLPDAENNTMECKNYFGVFNWQPLPEPPEPPNPEEKDEAF